jgi:hypothetical protein
MFTKPGEKATKCFTMRSRVRVWHANVIGAARPGLEPMN